MAPDLFSVPRRFDLFTILVATTAYAVLFASLRLLDFSSARLGVAGGLFAAVAIGQVAAKKKSPRVASIYAAVLYWIFVIAISAYIQRDRPRNANLGNVFLALVFVAPTWGVITGYVVGVLAAGVFLVSHHLRTKWSFIAQRRSPSTAHESPWDETS
jgi:hypothetical protein